MILFIEDAILDTYFVNSGDHLPVYGSNTLCLKLIKALKCRFDLQCQTLLVRFHIQHES